MMPIGMPPDYSPPPGDAFTDQLRQRMGPGNAAPPGAPPMLPGPGGLPQGGQIPPQLLLMILQMLMKGGQGAPMPGAQPGPGMPPVPVQPNRPPGSY